MANSLSANASLSAIVDQFTLAGNAAVATQTTGSNGIGISVTIATGGSWQSIDVSELSDFRYGWFYNDTTGSSIITVATGSAGQNILCKLQPGDTSLVSWSGSIASLYAKTTGPDTILQCVLVES